MEWQRYKESDHQMREMHQQMELLQKLVQYLPKTALVQGPDKTEHTRLTWLSDGDNMEAYLNTFERMMEAYGVSREIQTSPSVDVEGPAGLCCPSLGQC